jgi:hypothetical protein
MVLLLAHAGVSVQSAELPAGFTPIFNGTDLNGWWGLGTEAPTKWRSLSPEQLAEKKAASIADINAHWRAENGILINDGKGLYLTTDKDYSDFELRLDYKTVAKADSGVYLRGMPQIQIWDSTLEENFNIGANKGSGGLWNNSKGAAGKDPLVLADKPFGEWNSFRIIMVGERVTVWLNDKLVVDHARMENDFDRNSPIPRTGPIQLQTHGGEISWRNLIIREIEPKEAVTILRHNGPDKPAPTNDGYESIFNGTDFTGWSGPTENYSIADGSISCKEGKGGTIHTTAIYQDFTVSLDILIPPGSNNGLALRYPGKGDTAYVGMCELQTLDSEHPKYAKLDARQYHGSAYGMAAAHRGYLYPAGTWNFQTVDVRGSTITVELNGTRILSADLSKITEYKSNSPHPGKDRTEGHFGFAGHDDTVSYRNIRIKR